MSLLSDVQSEQHTSKELAVRLGQQEEELRDIRRQVSGCHSDTVSTNKIFSQMIERS